MAWLGKTVKAAPGMMQTGATCVQYFHWGSIQSTWKKIQPARWINILSTFGCERSIKVVPPGLFASVPPPTHHTHNKADDEGEATTMLRRRPPCDADDEL
jgi:hypothetical protein